MLQQVVQLTPDGHPGMSVRLNNLGAAFQIRLEYTGDVSDLTEAISIQHRAVQPTPNGHPDRPIRLHNLGMSLQSRFGRIGDVSDLTEAISIQQQVVQLTSDGHPDMPMRLHNLGASFQSRFDIQAMSLTSSKPSQFSSEQSDSSPMATRACRCV